VNQSQQNRDTSLQSFVEAYRQLNRRVETYPAVETFKLSFSDLHLETNLTCRECNSPLDMYHVNYTGCRGGDVDLWVSDYIRCPQRCKTSRMLILFGGVAETDYQLYAMTHSIDSSEVEIPEEFIQLLWMSCFEFDRLDSDTYERHCIYFDN